MTDEYSECPSLLVVVVNYRTEELTLQCVETMRRDLACAPKVVVVDVAATAETTAVLAGNLDDSVTLVSVSDNCGYGPAVNRGAREGADWSYLLAIGSDCMISGRTLCLLSGKMAADPDLGVVAPAVQRSAAGARAKIVHGFRSLRREWTMLVKGPRPFDETGAEDGDGRRWLTGACLMFRATAFADIGGFSEDYFMYAEDIDVCWRLQVAGWKVDTEASAEVVHLEGASTSRTWNPQEVRRRKMRSEARFYARYTNPTEFVALTAVRVVRVLSGRSSGAIHRCDAFHLVTDAATFLLTASSHRDTRA